MEAGLSAVKNAPRAAAIIDSLERVYPNTIKLSAGDNYIPGPFLNASSDASLRTPIRTANRFIFNNIDSTAALRENYARCDISFMHAIGYHASAIGNHEFDLGTAVFADAIRVEVSGTELRWMGAQFPYLSSNLDFSQDASLASLFTNTIRPHTDYATHPNGAKSASFKSKIAPATTVMIGGEKIGVVGATTQILESISSTGGVRVKGVKQDDMDVLATYIQPYIDDLISVHGCNKIILLSHLQQIALEKQLVGKLSGVDIIVAAGSHTLQSDNTDILRAGDVKADDYPTITKTKDNDDALIVCTDGEWKYVGRLVVEFDNSGKIILGSLDESINGAYATDSLGVVRVWGDYDDAFVTGSKGELCRTLANAVQSVIVAQDGDIYGKTSVFLEGRRTAVRTQETNFGSLTAEANLWYARKVDPTVKVSIKNGGGIRSAIGEVKVDGITNVLQLLPPSANPQANKNAGDISRLDILNSLRFNNGLTLVTLTAAQLRQTLNHGVSAWTTTATPGQFPQVSGVRFRFDPKLPSTNRITELMIVDSTGKIEDVIVQRGVLVGDPNRLIRVVSLNFLVDQSGAGPNGGDGYPFNAFVLANPTQANKVFITKGNSDPKTGAATFANDGSEQDAFAEFLKTKYSANPITLKDTSANRDFAIQNLHYHSDFFKSNERKVIYTTLSGVKVTNGGYGSDMCMVPGKTDEFYMLTDRGPNADSAGVAGKKVFSNPEYAPQIGKFVLKGDSIVRVENLTLKRNNGSLLTGLPNPIGYGSTGEIAYNLDLILQSPDPEGIDPEGLVAMEDGSFWVSDEYGPHLVHFDAQGNTIERVNAFGNGLGGRSLPQVFAKRWANRGMEGLTITPSGKLVGIMQSRLYNPSSALATNTRLTRILLFDPVTAATEQYIYMQELSNGSNSGIVAISDTTFLVLERDQNLAGGSPAAAVKRIYKINISDATDVSDPANGSNGLLFAGKTLEQHSVSELEGLSVYPVSKTLMADLLTDIPYYPHDKLEGMAIVNDSIVVVINDDDFAVNPNATGSYDQKVLPLNKEVDNATMYYVKLRSKLTNIGAIVTSVTSPESAEEKAQLHVYPNPVQDRLYMDKVIAEGVLVDVLGNTVRTIRNANQVYVGDLTPGVYVLKSGTASVKVLIK
jgi:2',3'-cyclic-nucleotide 2'-phosphodiesterase (5'-nucleotidase family)